MAIGQVNEIMLGDHWAQFGDGNMAQIVDSKDIIKDNGITYVRFILVPSKRIEQKFDIKSQQDPTTGYILKEFKWTDVIWLERGTTRSRCWILPDFDNKPTPASRRHEELAATLTDTTRLLRSAEAAKHRLFQELEKERQYTHQSIKSNVQILREVAKARGRVDNDGEDGMGGVDVGD